MNKSSLFYLFALLSGLCFLLVEGARHLYSQYQQTHFSCDTMLVVHHEEAELALAIGFIFRGNNGIVSLKGTLHQGSRVTNVSRKSYFTFNQSKGFYQLNSILAVTTPADNSKAKDIAHYLPPFYLQKGLKFEFMVYPVDKQGFVFSTGYVPSFYCSQS